MVDLFVPEIPRIPSLQDHINAAGNEISTVLTKRMMQFDADIVSVLVVIADALCRSGHLMRTELLQTLERLQKANSVELSGEYSPIALLAKILRDLDETPLPPGNKPTPAWLMEVIEGGKGTPHSTD